MTDELGSLFLKPCVGAGGSWHDTEVVGDRDDDQIVCGFEELAHLCLSLVAPRYGPTGMVQTSYYYVTSVLLLK